MTSYFECLMRSGIRSEDDYIGDASRFLRYLLSEARDEDILRFFAHCSASPGYQRRLRRTLRRFFAYLQEHLEIEVEVNDAFRN